MNILIVEDDELLQSGIDQSLKRNGWRCDVVSSVQAAKKWLKACPYSLILLDLGLPDGDGIALLREWRSEQIKTPIIILTARDEVEDRIIGLNSGADDYLLKPFSIAELIARIQAVLRRSEGQSDNRLIIQRLQIDIAQKTAYFDKQEIFLTPREFALLLKLALKADKIVARDILMNDIYALSDQVGSNTLEVYIHHLRQKLPSKAIETIRSRGYRLRVSYL